MKIIGLTGTIGAGKALAKEILERLFDCHSIKLSDVIRREAKRKGCDRKTLQDLGNELRRRHGGAILVKLATQNLPKNKELLIIDGIRNPAEIDYLRKGFGKDFVFIAIDARPEIRFERLLKRGKETDPKSWEEFVAMDERDLGKNEPSYGQQNQKCMERADFLIINEGDKKQLEAKITQVMDRLTI